MRAREREREVEREIKRKRKYKERESERVCTFRDTISCILDVHNLITCLYLKHFVIRTSA